MNSYKFVSIKIKLSLLGSRELIVQKSLLLKQMYKLITTQGSCIKDLGMHNKSDSIIINATDMICLLCSENIPYVVSHCRGSKAAEEYRLEKHWPK